PGTVPLDRTTVRHTGIDRIEKNKLSVPENITRDHRDGHALPAGGGKALPQIDEKAHRDVAHLRDRHHVPMTTERLKAGKLDHLLNSHSDRQVELKKPFQLHEHGDLARRMKLGDSLARHGGWQHRFVGHVSPLYSKHAFGHSYCGPGFYPHHCWFP